MGEYTKGWIALITAAVTVAGIIGIPVTWASPALIAGIGTLIGAAAVVRFPNTRPEFTSKNTQ